MALRPPVTARLADGDAERVRRSHDEKIREIQALPAASMRVIPEVQLADATETPVAHGLGRKPSWVHPSCPRGIGGAIGTTGRIVEIRSGTYDRTKVVVLKADGWVGPIMVDVMVI